uniref:Uncharacterized protein n=1 Tax=Gokushovirinae environmental samples TaxID=1478972 RepID=A0A2R3UAG2_9VIRU|nr:hypothetical protein [Gokushovirinae environmental samples]
MMAKRSRISRGKSRRSFTKHASKVHKRNVPKRTPMRGGIRL